MRRDRGRTGRAPKDPIGRTVRGGAWCLAVAAGVATTAPAQVYNRSPQVAEPTPTVTWPIHYGRFDRASLEAAAAVPGSPEHHLRRFLELHTAMRYADARVEAERVAALAPDRPLAQYNLACVLARLDQHEAAFVALDEALRVGWRNALQARIDPDLRGLRVDPRFGDWLERVCARAEAEQPAPGPRRRDDWESVRSDLAGAAPGLMRRYHVPGLAIALVRDGRLVWHEGFGRADDSGLRPFGADESIVCPAALDLLTVMAAITIDEAGGLGLDALLRAPGAEDAHGEDDVRTAFAPRATRTGRLASGRAPAEGSEASAEATGAVADWPVTLPSPLGERLRRELERRTGSFAGFCDARFIQPLGLEGTSTRPSDLELDAAALGFSRLGTCLLASRGRDGMAVTTTALDLARLVASLGAGGRMASGTGGLTPDERQRLADVAALDLPRLGLPLELLETWDGPMLQIAGMENGVGCLVRSYPEDGDAVVIVFNAVTGADVAVRLAQRALGGRVPRSR